MFVCHSILTRYLHNLCVADVCGCDMQKLQKRKINWINGNAFQINWKINFISLKIWKNWTTFEELCWRTNCFTVFNTLSCSETEDIIMWVRISICSQNLKSDSIDAKENKYLISKFQQEYYNKDYYVLSRIVMFHK